METVRRTRGRSKQNTNRESESNEFSEAADITNSESTKNEVAANLNNVKSNSSDKNEKEDKDTSDNQIDSNDTTSTKDSIDDEESSEQQKDSATQETIAESLTQDVSTDSVVQEKNESEAEEKSSDTVIDEENQRSATQEKIGITSREETKTSLPRGKKRKAEELKSEDENANEEDISSQKVEDIKQTVEEEVGGNSKDESGICDSDIFSVTQSLGKGKRARIPNKRYSDILLSPSLRSKSSENGSDKVESEKDFNTDISIKEEPSSPVLSPMRTRARANSPVPLNKKQKLIDITDPKYLKPFKYGWKRELVFRGTPVDSSGKKTSDIYYYMPSGKKLRSMREIADNLRGRELTIENFTFFKETFGTNDPDKEIIRDAKNKITIVPIKKASRSPKPLSPKVSSPRVVSPKIASPKATSPKATNETADSSLVKSKATGKNLGNFKIKLPAKKDKKPVKSEEMEVEAPVKPITGRRSTRKSATVSPIKTKRRAVKTNSEEKEENSFMDNYLQNISYGYNTLLHVFQYLKVQDLLRAGCVCTMWRDIASHPMLWRTVRMKNSQVHSFEGLANTLKKHGTKHLDLRKMLLPNGGDEIWPEFSKAIEKVDTLRRIELCRCPASVVEKLAISNPQLGVVNAVTIKCESMDLEPLQALKHIKELRIKSTGGLTLTSNIDSLREMKQLKHLSLTSIRDLDKMNLSVIAELINLESLDLGECTDFPKSFGSNILIKLEKLEKLRLEKGQGNCHTFEILDAVKSMVHLEQLELVNFDIKAGFDKAVGACQNIRKLLIIPTYISQSATTNHMVLGGVLRLQKTLSHFVWGVTLELLRVTELFVDQCEEPKKEKKPIGNGDSIPVLKPVPLLVDQDSEIPPAHDPPQVEILALPSLQKLLMQNLPTTRVKILKIPFHATWRQSITDTVN